MKDKETVEYRYYELPLDLPVIALTGKEWEVPYGRDPMHFHNCLEIGVCYYGEGEIYFGQQRVPYCGGTITLIPKDFPHHTQAVNFDIQKWEYLFVDAEKFLMEKFQDRPAYARKLLKRLSRGMISAQMQEHQDIYEVLRLIFHDMEHREEFFEENVSNLLCTFLLKMIQLTPKEERFDTTVSEHAVPAGIAEILQYMDEHYNMDLRLKDLAKQGKMSETNFRRVFKVCTGVTPIEYIHLIRIEKACEMLKQTDESIDLIAEKVGYPVVATFNRNFRKIVGYTPQAWRQLAKKQGDVLVGYKVSVKKGW